MTEHAESIPPLFFKPVYKDYLWGGDALARRYGRIDAPSCCAESWELSAREEGMSIVANGPFAGRSLEELCSTFGRALLGSSAPSATRFPLLFKLIDARVSLSVQIHPSPKDPLADLSEIKNECWHCLDRDQDSRILAGFVDGVSKPSDIPSPSALPSILRQHEPRPDETLYIPSGLVHAIGAGNLIYEVQQSSNTTYRFYDWDRLDRDGNPRTLHVAEAMRSIDWSLPPPSFVKPVPCGEGVWRCLETPYFTIREVRPRDDGGETGFDTRGESFHALFVKSGAFEVKHRLGACFVGSGTSVLLPANLGAYALKGASREGAVLVTTL